MITVVAHDDVMEAASLVAAALRRSVGHGQVGLSGPAGAVDASGIVVLVDPADALDDCIRAQMAGGPAKLIIFGRMPAALGDMLGVSRHAEDRRDRLGWTAEAAPAHAFRESPAFVQYSAVAERLGGRAWRRPLQRFDFGNEWNNLGYGAITADNSIWSLGPAVDVPPDAEIAAVMMSASARFGSYAALFDSHDHSILWFNRPVGPMDSFEWRLVERFLASHRADELPAQPVLSEIPFGHDAAVTMRLDCDEDIESARALWSSYRRRGVPLSLAVHTGLLAEHVRVPLFADVLSSGGSVLSHSASHPANWGGSYAAALDEAVISATLLEKVTGQRPRFAVSPFHQTPHYALKALHAAGYEGCIGGNIASDPAFVLARGGSLAGLPPGFVGHTQQCMLHGDCLLDGNDPMMVYRQAFDLALETRSIFAYLDHPLSARYDYGWGDEEARIEAHRMLLDHIAATAKAPAYLSADATLDFLGRKSRIEVAGHDGGFIFERVPDGDDGLRLCVEFRGEVVEISEGTELR